MRKLQSYLQRYEQRDPSKACLAPGSGASESCWLFNSRGKRAKEWGCSLLLAKSRTRLSNFTFTFHFHALEKEMATHSSVLAWRISGTGEPAGLPSMGSQSWT